MDQYNEDQYDIFEKYKNCSYKSVKKSIPKEAVETPMENWDKLGKMEWRWRFLILPNKKKVVEISRMTPVSPNREYVKENGQWVFRIVPACFDDYVTESYYYYTELL